MSDTQVNEHLPFADAFFLYVEQPGAPVNVALIGSFEGVISLAECMEYVDSRLALIPRFLKRVVIPPLSVGPPTLQCDPHFDVSNHVHEITLRHGTDAEWKSAVSEIMSTHLDRGRPLWNITLIHGLKGDRTGMVLKVHHCLVDGIGGIGLLNALLTDTPVIPPFSRRKPNVLPPPQHEPGFGLLDDLISSCFLTGQAFLTAHSALLQMAHQASHPAAHTNGNGTHAEQVHAAVSPLACIAPLSDFARLLSELAQPTETLPYNVLCHGPQKFEWTEIPMVDIAAVRQVSGTTVNDVVLTVLSAALRRYAELHKLSVKGRKLRIVVPVNVRSEGKSSDAGNQITFLPVDIPGDIREPLQLLARVQKRVKFSKTAHGAELIALAALVLAALPPSLQSLAGAVLSRLKISLCNSICTNVPGPKTPLYLLGHKMLSSYPYVPIGGEMGMNCAVMSYNGTLFVGFTGDAQAIPDISSLAAFFRESFAELREAVSDAIPEITPPKPKAKRVARKVRAAPVSGIQATPVDRAVEAVLASV